jgi:hypothetical protein
LLGNLAFKAPNCSGRPKDVDGKLLTVAEVEILDLEASLDLNKFRNLCTEIKEWNM